jgi:hypothetical protein
MSEEYSCWENIAVGKTQLLGEYSCWKNTAVGRATRRAQLLKDDIVHVRIQTCMHWEEDHYN